LPRLHTDLLRSNRHAARQAARERDRSRTRYEVDNAGSPNVTGVENHHGTALSEVSVPTTKNEYRLDYTYVENPDGSTTKKVKITFGEPQDKNKSMKVTTSRSGGSTPKPSNEKWSTAP